MTTKVISVSLDTSISEVSKLLADNRIHGVPVLKNNFPVGIVTQADLFSRGLTTIYLPEYVESIKEGKILGKISESERKKMKAILNTAAKDIMTSPCVTIKESDDVKEVLNLIREKKLVTIPVINNEEKIVGIVTLFDIIQLASNYL